MKKALVILVALLFTLCLAAPALAYLGNPRTMKFHNESCRTIKHRFVIRNFKTCYKR